jgi:enolase-phosphatase E1
MNFSLSNERIRGILLDVEGTTTPIPFVYETLFPFVRRHLPEFFKSSAADPEMQQIIAALKLEHEEDARTDLMTPEWDNEPVAYVNWLMDQDRKATPLKALQGKLWLAGYQTGKLKGQVFDDVVPALRRWNQQDIDVRIFSSGSVLSQQLLFSTTPEGDLTRWIRGHFDTSAGAKSDSASYTAIARAFSLKPKQILFVTDVTRELDAARQAGMKTLLCMRPGNSPQVMHEHKPIASFEEIAD